MTVKQLMSDVDINRVVDAFILLDYNFSESNYESNFFEKYEAISNIRKIIEINVKLFVECKAGKNTDLHTIFIIQHRDYEDYENMGKSVLTGFATRDEEVLQVLDKDFHIFDNEGEAELRHYGFDYDSMEDMVNYIISESSIREIGKEVCAAKILSELFFWGAFPEDRKKRIGKTYEKLTQPITEKKLVDEKTFTEIMDKHMEEIMSKMSDDEKAYTIAKEKFEKETEGIRERYKNKVISEIHKQYIKAIKEEYIGRVC